MPSTIVSMPMNGVTVAGGQSGLGIDHGDGKILEGIAQDLTPGGSKATFLNEPISVGIAITGPLTDSLIYNCSTGSKIAVTEISANTGNDNTLATSFRVGFGTTTVPSFGGPGLVLSSGGLANAQSITRGTGAGMLGMGTDDQDLRITCTDPGGVLHLNVTLYVIPS